MSVQSCNTPEVLHGISDPKDRDVTAPQGDRDVTVVVTPCHGLKGVTCHAFPYRARARCHGVTLTPENVTPYSQNVTLRCHAISPF